VYTYKHTKTYNMAVPQLSEMHLNWVRLKSYMTMRAH